MKKSDMTKLFNSKVEKVAHLTRPLKYDSVKLGAPLQGITQLEHQAVLVNLENGNQYVIESGQNYAKSGGAIIKNANHAESLSGWEVKNFHDIK